MATYRIGIGSFNLKDGAVGLGTESSGLGNLKVEGTVKTTDLDVTGVSTFYRYAGFVAEELNIINPTSTDGVSLTGEHSTLGDIVVGTGNTLIVGSGATITVGTVESVSIGTHFSPPTGGIEERPEVPVEGTVRFNRDLNTLEFYNGFEWRQFNVNGVTGRMVIGGGRKAPLTETIRADFLQIPTLGNTTHFGDLTDARDYPAGCSNEIRGLVMGGDDGPAATNIIDYFTIPSRGNAHDFGNLSNSTLGGAACSSSTRGVFSGGQTPTVLNVIDYVEIMTTGDATDFGDLINTSRYNHGFSSPTRGFFAGGLNPTKHPYTEVITIATKGNSVKFGNCQTGYSKNTFSNSVRGVMTYGYAPTISAGIEYVTMASEGNAVYFGELTVARGFACSSANQTRGVVAGGNEPSPSYYNVIDYVTIASTGNALDFGDCSDVMTTGFGFSDSHGGLGGY